MTNANEYDDDYYEDSDFDISNLQEEFNDSPVPSFNNENYNKKSQMKKKRRLDDWLEEKRLRDELSDDSVDLNE